MTAKWMAQIRRLEQAGPDCRPLVYVARLAANDPVLGRTIPVMNGASIGFARRKFYPRCSIFVRPADGEYEVVDVRGNVLSRGPSTYVVSIVKLYHSIP